MILWRRRCHTNHERFGVRCEGVMNENEWKIIFKLQNKYVIESVYHLFGDFLPEYLGSNHGRHETMEGVAIL